MTTLTLSGVVLGLRSKPYDFNNDAGERVAGTSHRLVMFDPQAVEPIELAVRQDHLGLVGGLAEGEMVSVQVTVSANNNKVVFSLAGVADAPAARKAS